MRKVVLMVDCAPGSTGTLRVIDGRSERSASAAAVSGDFSAIYISSATLGVKLATTAGCPTQRSNRIAQLADTDDKRMKTTPSPAV